MIDQSKWSIWSKTNSKINNGQEIFSQPFEKVELQILAPWFRRAIRIIHLIRHATRPEFYEGS